MQHRVQRARAKLVPVPPQFFDHPEPKDGLLAGVIKNVDANQTRKEFLVPNVANFGQFHRMNIEARYRKTIA